MEIVPQQISMGRRTSQQKILCSCPNWTGWWFQHVSTMEDIVRVKIWNATKDLLATNTKTTCVTFVGCAKHHPTRIHQAASKPRRPVAVISRLRPKYSSSVTFVEPRHDVANTLSCLQKMVGRHSSEVLQLAAFELVLEPWSLLLLDSWCLPKINHGGPNNVVHDNTWKWWFCNTAPCNVSRAIYILYGVEVWRFVSHWNGTIHPSVRASIHIPV